MSQNASVSQNPILDHPETASSSPPDRDTAQLSSEYGSNYGLGDRCESVADCLMDEIFSDVERMLERGVDLSPESSEPKSPPAQTMAELNPIAMSSLYTDAESAPDRAMEVPSFALAPRLSPRPSMLEQAQTDEELADLAELMAEVNLEQPPAKPPRSFDKLLLSLVIASFALAGGLWFYFRDRLQPPMTATAPPSAETMQQQQNQAFLNYVGRSLDRIERDAKVQREAAVIASASPTPTVSPSPSTVLERVYIPIYQQPPASAPAPTRPSTPTAVAPSVPPRTAPSVAPSAAVPTTAASVPNISPSATHVLIGVLELGNRSAALFEINGTPQRIQIGEAIGDSGWTLVSIANQEAIVRRNGEVRSIYVGQQF